MNAFGKGLFALLVLANVGLWLWATGFRPGDAPAEGARAPLNPERMRLLNEPGAPPAPRTEAAPPTACYRLGPFPDEASAEAAAARLVKQGVPVGARRAEDQTVVSGYRVYLLPLPSRAAAEKKRRELVRLGFKDTSVLQEEGGQNAISLGLFTVEANARKRLQALAAKKIEAQLQTLTQVRRVYGFTFGPVENPTETLGRLRDSEGDNAGVNIEETACPAAGTGLTPGGGDSVQ